jgi:tetratricopeptide (TPR) repeat protein
LPVRWIEPAGQAHWLPEWAPTAPLPVVPEPARLVGELLQTAATCFQARDFAAADAFRELVPLAAEDPPRAWVQAGHLYFALADYEAAGRAYGHAAAFAPRDAALQVRLALTCLRLNDVSAFEAYLARALNLDPESPAAWQLLADLNRQHGEYARAASCLRRLIERDPAHHGHRVALAECLLQLGMPPGAAPRPRRSDPPSAAR